MNVHDANRARPTTRVAPSWSWASINGSVEFESHVFVGNKDSEDVISVDIGPPEGTHPFQSTIYRLRIRSRMKSLRRNSFTEPNYSESSSRTFLMLYARGDKFRKGPEVAIWGDYHLRPYIEGSRILKFCAVTLHTTVDTSSPIPGGWTTKKVVWGLLLVQIGQGRFERIGCGFCSLSWFEDAVEATAEII